MQAIPQCMMCKHYQDTMSCAAFPNDFPEGIPAAIVHNQKDHRKPISGDNGIQWEPGDDWTASDHPLEEEAPTKKQKVSNRVSNSKGW